MGLRILNRDKPNANGKASDRKCMFKKLLIFICHYRKEQIVIGIENRSYNGHFATLLYSCIVQFIMHSHI